MARGPLERVISLIGLNKPIHEFSQSRNPVLRGKSFQMTEFMVYYPFVGNRAPTAALPSLIERFSSCEVRLLDFMSEGKVTDAHASLPVFEPLEPRVMLSGAVEAQLWSDPDSLGPAAANLASGFLALPGDANDDMTVNSDDYGILLSQFGQTAALLDADFDDNGIVDFEDFAILRANLGSTVTSIWTPIVTEDFSDPASTGWTYAGPAGESDLFAPNGVGAIDAEWSQSKVYAEQGPGGSPLDPYDFQPSHYSRPLGQTLTDNDDFQVGATVIVDSIVDITTFYQVANFGLYNLAEMGADRTMSDNWSGNENLVKDGSDFVEFNYFIGTDWSGRNITATIGAHVDGVEGSYVSGSFTDPMWHNPYLGNEALPTGTPLYVEVTYFSDTRRAVAAVYSDADRTELLTINVGGTDVEQYYWTTPLPDDKGFTLTDVAFFNYVGADWIGSVDGAGSGSFDDLYVNILREGASLDTIPPHVAATTPAVNSTAPDGDPNGADPGRITVTFSEPLGSELIDSAANYSLFRDTNGDGAFFDETAVTLTAQTADNQTVYLDTGSDLAPGNYLLRLNGTVDNGSGVTPLRDVAGNTLDGDADGLAGGDWFGEFSIGVAGSPAAAQTFTSPTVQSVTQTTDDTPAARQVFGPIVNLLVESPLPVSRILPDRTTAVGSSATALHRAATADNDLQTLGDDLLFDPLEGLTVIAPRFSWWSA